MAQSCGGSLALREALLRAKFAHAPYPHSSLMPSISRYPALLSISISVLVLAADRFSPLQAEAPSKPIPVVFDTDMGNDVDDAMALALLHQLERRGALRLLAVTSTKDHPKSAPYIDALNRYYGAHDIPVGAVRDGATPAEGRFLGLIDRNDEEGRPLYPRELESGEDAPEAVDLLRQVLAAEEDGSVVLLQVGFFTNFARLLDSAPDEHSALPGEDLVRAKVRELVIMAGAFQTIRHNTKHLEYNVRIDVPSAQSLAERWPTPVVWSGYEIGIAAAYPWKSIVEDYEYLPHHLIKESYLAYAPQHPHDRPTWDLTCVLYAAYPDRGYFDLSPAGTVEVDDEGRTDFTMKEGGNHRYLLMDPIQTERVREAFVLLCSEPPAGR